MRSRRRWRAAENRFFERHFWIKTASLFRLEKQFLRAIPYMERFGRIAQTAWTFRHLAQWLCIAQVWPPFV